MQNIVLSPTDFVALLNQTLEFAYPSVTIAGELANFRISKGKWAYFELKDEYSSVKFFGTVFNMPGPVEEGMLVEVVGQPRLSPKYGFSVNFQTLKPIGQGSIKRAAELLKFKLEKEGLFDAGRKRSLPYPPQDIGLITSKQSAAYGDFIKIINNRWAGLKISHVNVSVQGAEAASEIINAIEILNTTARPPEVIVLIRGGGSPDDLDVFNNEQLTRAVASSRIPVLAAVGHETDICLVELAADVRSSTPSHAAETLVPDRKREQRLLGEQKSFLKSTLNSLIKNKHQELSGLKSSLRQSVEHQMNIAAELLKRRSEILKLLNPNAVLTRGYAIVRLGERAVTSVKQLKPGDELNITFKDGTAGARVDRLK